MTTLKDKLFAYCTKAPDLDLVIKITKIDGKEFINIRDYVPSTKKFGHGVMFDKALLPEVIEYLNQLNDSIGVGNGRPGPGQGEML
jgi:hypothetical protein